MTRCFASVVPSLVLMALIVTAPGVRADEVSGRALARQAQQALADGDPDRAIELIERARIEWPGAPVVAHTLGDARYRLGDYAAALVEYDKGSGGALAFRAFFNQGVTLNAIAEDGLTEAAVPLDPVGIPADVDPGPMLQAIDKGLKTLELARGHFLDALGHASNAKVGEAASARESVAAINKRTDDLREMKEELEKRRQEQEDQEDQEGEDDQESEDQESEDGEEGEDGEDGDQDQEQEQDQQEDGEKQEGEDKPDEQQGEGDEPQEPTEPEQRKPVPGQETQLSPQEMVQLLDQLEQLEERARAIQRVRRAQQREAVERDW